MAQGLFLIFFSKKTRTLMPLSNLAIKLGCEVNNKSMQENGLSHVYICIAMIWWSQKYDAIAVKYIKKAYQNYV